MTAARRVAVIGVGRMGGPMADRIAAHGFDVRVHDVDQDAMAARVTAGAATAHDAAEAAAGAEIVCVVVFDDAQAVESVAGERGVLTTLTPGAVIALHTTVMPVTIHELSARADAVGVTVLDAGISGGEPGVAAGTLLTMVGGPAEAVELARPVLDAFSKEVLHAGPLGAGMALKLARNATGYAMMAAVHEAMLLAEAAGVDLATLGHVIAETGVLDQALAPLSLGGPAPLPPDAPAEQRVAMEHLDRLAAKDLDATLALAASDDLDVEIAVFRAVRTMFGRVSRLG